MSKTTVQRQKEAVEKVIAAYTDGHPAIFERAAKAVLRQSFIPIGHLRYQAADEAADEETAYSLREGWITEISEEELEAGLIAYIEGLADLRFLTRRYLRAQLQSKGIEVIPWDGDS